LPCVLTIDNVDDNPDIVQIESILHNNKNGIVQGTENNLPALPG
jgi:hypothetical protein